MYRAAAAFLSLNLLAPLAAQDPATIDWREDLEAARAEALRTDKPLLAVFRCEP
jgi:hypothetical protein